MITGDKQIDFELCKVDKRLKDIEELLKFGNLPSNRKETLRIEKEELGELIRVLLD